MEVLVMRGLPGAGKSTWIDTHLKANGASYDVCSADHYWLKDNEYRFDIKKLDKAHGSCLRKFIKLMADHHTHYLDFLVVDNTNILNWEMSPYIQIARAYDTSVRIIEFGKVRPLDAFQRCVHGVPIATINRMYKDMQKQSFPTAWDKMLHFGKKLEEFEKSLLRT